MPGSFAYGQLLLDLTLQAVPLRHLMPLRAINRYARSFVDSRIFKQVTLRTDVAVPGGELVIPVITETRQPLPVPDLTPSSPIRSAQILLEYLDKYTTALDLERVHDDILRLLGDGKMTLSRLEYLRLRSDNDGFHTETLSYCFGAPSVVVFPSFNPFIGWHTTGPEFSPSGMTKLVQHVAPAIDWRDPVPFNSSMYNHTIKDEIWVMTLLDRESGWGGRYRSSEDRPGLHENFVSTIAFRLKVGINLTLIGLEIERGTTEWLVDHYRASTTEELHDGFRSDLRRNWGVTEEAIRYLNFKTWAEYAATLTQEQLAMESLPRRVRTANF